MAQIFLELKFILGIQGRNSIAIPKTILRMILRMILRFIF